MNASHLWNITLGSLQLPCDCLARVQGAEVASRGRWGQHRAGLHLFMLKYLVDILATPGSSGFWSHTVLLLL